MLTSRPARRRRRIALAGLVLPAAVLGVLLSSSQQPAQAGLLDDILSGPGGLAGPVVGGINGVACEQAGQLPVLGQGFCLLKSAAIKYRTTYRRADGTELVRTINGMPALPSLINADDDALVEGTAVLAIKSTTTFELRFDRFVLEAEAVPVKFEVIVPMPGASPEKDRVYLGFDARQGRMPATWKGTIVLVENTETRTRIGLEISRSGAAPRLQVIGGLYDGPVASPVDPTAVILDPQPVPDTLAAGLLMVDDPAAGTELEVAASASSPTSVTASVVETDGAERQDVTAFIKDLPANPVRVQVVSPTESEKHVTYTAGQRQPEVRFTSESRVFGSLTDRLQVQLEDLPTGLTFDQPRPGAGSIGTSGGAIGRARVLINDGSFAPLPTPDGPHVAYRYDGVLGAPVQPGAKIPSALDIEIQKLVSAGFDANADFTVEATTQPVGGQVRQTLRGYVEDQSTVVDAVVEQIPARLKVVATESGEIRYDGFGQTVPRIDASVRALTGTLSPDSRYTQVDARILDLPAKVDVAVSPTADRVVADAGVGVGSLRVHARDATSSCQAQLADERGAVVVDTPSAACLAARFDGLRTADVQIEPLAVKVTSAQAQDLVLRATVDEAGDAVAAPGQLVGRITQMPSDFDLAVLPGDTVGPDTTERYVLRSNAVTPELTLTGTNLPESFGNGFLDFAITGLPDEVDVELPNEGEFQNFVLDAPDGIGKVELELSQRNTPCLNKVSAEAGVGILDTALSKCLGVRIAGVKHAELQLEPLLIKTETATALDFQISALIDDLGDQVSGPGVLEARITKLPRQLEIVGATVQVPATANSSTLNLTVKIPSSQTITALDFEGTNLPETFPARYLDLRVEGVTDLTTIRVPKAGEVQHFGLGTIVAPIRLIAVQLSDDGTEIPLDPARDSVVVEDGAVAVRLNDLVRARFANRLGEGPRYDGTFDVFAKHGEDPYSRPLHVVIDQDGTQVNVDLPTQPAEIGFIREGTYSPGSLYEPDRPAMMRLSASDSIPQVVFSLDGDDDSSIDLDVKDLPSNLNICLWSGGGTDHQVTYSDPGLSDPTWCYHPEKKPWAQGGDPFALFDTVQFSLTSSEELTDPIRLTKLDLRSKDSSGTSRTTVTQGTVGLMEFAFGQGFIWGDYNDPRRQAMYSGDDDSESFDGVFDEQLPDRKGLHFFADTDDIGFAAKLRYEFVDAVTGDSEVTVLTSLQRLIARNKIAVLDMTGIPGEVRHRGSIGVCSLDPAKFELTKPGFPPVIAAASLADYLNCAL